MYEIWLRPNRRALAFACVPAALLAAVGLAMMAAGAHSAWWRILGLLHLLFSAILLAMLFREMSRPRIAYRDGSVLFYLRTGRPFEVPAPVVEAFFLGQGPASLPGRLAAREETVNLVARLAQRHSEWAQQNVKTSLGEWCGGYVTIRGIWCEPLGPEIIRRLNRRLKEVKTTSDSPANRI